LWRISNPFVVAWRTYHYIDSKNYIWGKKKSPQMLI
jgi:hypothetical protein